MEGTRHPQDPQSNVAKFKGYDPDQYILDDATNIIRTDESLTPGRPPRLTQRTVGKFLQPVTRELVEVPPRPTIDELPDAVIEQMVVKDKAFWVDKPGANAYTLHDAYYNYGMTTVIVKPPHQDVFPRSYQYDLDCVRYRRSHACDGLHQPEEERTVIAWTAGPKPAKGSIINISLSTYKICIKGSDCDRRMAPCTAQIALTGFREKPLSAHCRNCRKLNIPGLSPFQLAWAKDRGQSRWQYYPDVSAALPDQEICDSMKTVGRPYKNEACNWYYKNYPPVKYNCIMRKFSK